MFRKLKLKQQIKHQKAVIEELEHKRERSQAAIVRAIISQTEPDDAEVDFFNLFTGKIDEARDVLHQLMKEFDEL